MAQEKQYERRNISILDLFRSEVGNCVAALEKDLPQLERNPDDAKRFKHIIEGSDAIKGGAKLADLKALADLIHAMQGCLGDIHHGVIPFSAKPKDLLNQSISLLKQVAQVASPKLTRWMDNHKQEIEAMTAALMQASKSDMPDALSGAQHTEQVLTPEPAVLSHQSESAPPEQPPAIKKTGMADTSMLNLFQNEVSNYTDVLSEGLLEVENNPRAADKLESLMRAAHSIKGAARLVGIDNVVKIAHVMEDCFVAAQHGAITLKSEDIDTLLNAVDVLREISKDTSTDVEVSPAVDELVNKMAALSDGRPDLYRKGAIPVADTTQSENTALALSGPSASAIVASDTPAPVSPQDERDRMVRVTAAKIERIMGLTGEVVVSARWLTPFSESLMGLKRRHAKLAVLLEQLQSDLKSESKAESRFTLEEAAQHTGELALLAREKTRQCNLYLADCISRLDKFISTTATMSDRLYHEVISVRMRPFADGCRHFPRMVRDLARELGKKVRFEIIGEATEVDRDILEKSEAPLNHLLRNALDHGIESPAERISAGKPEIGSLRLHASHRSGMLLISVTDDGRGIDTAQLRQKILSKGIAGPEIISQLAEPELMDFLFLPGFSTSANVSEISGRGVGLDVVRTMAHEIGGVVRVDSKPGRGLAFYLELPLTRSVIRTFLVEINGEPYAFPLARIDRCQMLAQADIETVEDRQYFRMDNYNVALVDIYDVLEMNATIPRDGLIPVIVVSDRSDAYGLVVDKFIGEYDLVVRPLDPRLGNVPNINAVAVMMDGAPVLIFDLEDLTNSIDRLLTRRRLRKVRCAGDSSERKSLKRILVVDDSVTVREIERKLLENQGYRVELAVDGKEAWNAIRTEHFDMLVTDVDMPRMNGIELVARIRQQDDLKKIPIIIISYKDSEKHRNQGISAGADRYLTKSSFEDNSFLEMVAEMIGEA
ncbi:response regulator [Desulfococcaceae bacterium HSG9]|nr:response regulator [Desulfococcaceae bacterium HSG9]